MNTKPSKAIAEVLPIIAGIVSFAYGQSSVLIITFIINSIIGIILLIDSILGE